jgi:two-component system, chemotaxis family, response regulator Rcp1
MPIEILLVEDNLGDVRLVQEAFREASNFVRIHRVADGLQAMNFLRQKEEHKLAPRPDLILLDLNLPVMDGREVLATIKKDDGLKSVPVFIVTSSELLADVNLCDQHPATRYHRKPIQWDGFASLAKDISDLWRVKDTLPLAPEAIIRR